MRKLIVVATAALAVMTVTVTSAQADELVGPQGPLSNGAEVTLTSANYTWVSGWGVHECDTVTTTQEVIQNSSGWAELDAVDASAEGCSAPFQSISVGPIVMDLDYREGLADPVSFVWANGVCQAVGVLPFVYDDGFDVLTVTGTQQFGGTCGTATVSADFHMTDENGAPVTIE